MLRAKDEKHFEKKWLSYPKDLPRYIYERVI
jgi:hypothetical protein